MTGMYDNFRYVDDRIWRRVCAYINDDLNDHRAAGHGAIWHLDPGKLIAAFEHAGSNKRDTNSTPRTGKILKDNGGSMS